MRRNKKQISNFYNLNDIEHDGRSLQFSKDPPGQRSVYIMPGNPERESYRLTTFVKFPPEVPIDPRDLASSGFFYTGYKDRVKCFSCGYAAENWQSGDLPTDCRWHSDTCMLMYGNDERNIPLDSFFTNGRNRRTRLASDSVGVFEQQTARFDAATSAPLLPVTRRKVERQPFHSEALGVNTNGYPATYPCRNPINPHMRSKEARIQTFLDHITRWPANQLKATPAEIAEAGMFYLGERDRVKCWYCNGGLQNWERDDDPWTEHAKWFPQCEFVLQQKGEDFVRSITSRNPNLIRPILYNPSNSSRIDQQENLLPTIIDPQQSVSEVYRRINEEILKSDIVANAFLMGFDKELIEKALKKQYHRTKTFFSSCESLIDTLLELESQQNSNENIISQSTSSDGLPGVCTSRSNDDHKEKRGSCVHCQQKIADTVFVPCGHLVCCFNCGQSAEVCPTCKEIIQERFRSYIS